MNTTTSLILSIAQYTLPALVVFFAFKSLLNSYLGYKIKITQLQFLNQKQQQYSPLKLQAYERLVLLCQRISIDALLRRTAEASTAATAYFLLIHSINTEFEHNATQQIYVSEQSWQKLSQAQNQTIQIINQAYQSLSPSSSTTDLENAILHQISQLTHAPAQEALFLLKQEINQLIN